MSDVSYLDDGQTPRIPIAAPSDYISLLKPRVMSLVVFTALTGLLWLPYILDRIMVQGLSDAVSYPANPKPQSPWAQRLMKAHANAVENLVIFATLVLLLVVTSMAASLYLLPVALALIALWAVAMPAAVRPGGRALRPG